ncbi:MAG: Ni/Fe-hydrogenase cytochrome b subunit [Alphaproteobacteria bacterium]|nr:Ni/Fe-hydrogenase cytochrome b subunit [Alphaproteobacteria bacterium]MDE2109850.1 Ni/Fe-hydrogenase cytochrome b subunit [Alphaproteobacteria bacterium]
MSTAAPLRRNLITPTTLVLAALVVIGFYFLLQRFLFGLGAVANINPGYPWGIWVVVDVIIGTAFGCGGFAMALLVYIFNRGRYHSLMRPALLSGLFGYTLGGVAVIFDLGRYWHAYNLLLPWHAQLNSVMYEVALCVMAYVVVLWIEFSPAFLERWNHPGIKRFLDRWMYVFAALGVLLPTMHQSSLGSMLLVMGYKLSPLWFTLWLPALFVSSALAMGYGIVMFEATVVSKTFALPSQHALISKMSIVVGWIAVAWLALRWGDLFSRHVVAFAFVASVKVFLFWIENALFAAAALIFIVPAWRASRRASFLGAVALLAGGSLYRLDAYLIGYTPVTNWTYFPSAPELMVSIGIIALEVLLYLVFIKTLPVLHGDAAHR